MAQSLSFRAHARVRSLALVPALLLIASACQSPAQSADWPDGDGPPPRPAKPAAIATLQAPLERACAEWEPALGTLVAWPFRVPPALLVELARDDTLFVLVPVGDEEAARAELLEIGIDPKRFELISSTVETCWPRDYGPHEVFDERGTLTLIDAVYLDTPGGRADYSGPGGERPLKYWGDWPGDDTSPVGLAEHLGWPRIDVGAYLTGGNFLLDGFGRAFSTRIMLDENLQIMSAEQFADVVARSTGVRDLVLLDDTEEFGIQHIDCWLKPLDAETLLVKRAPQDHPEAAPIERNLEVLRKLETPFGRPYRILRIECPRYDGDRLAAYTNSLILNEKVLVPLFGDAQADSNALARWREALPGYQVIGFLYEGWRDFDALHCRTRAIFDPDMLRLVASRYGPTERGEADSIRLSLTVRDYGGAGLAEDGCAVFWRAVGERDWTRAPMKASAERGDGANAVFALELAQPTEGRELEYYFWARSKRGTEARLPAVGPDGPWRLRAP